MTTGIHHVTAITRRVQANVDFYLGFLGLRLVKQTGGFEDAEQLHLIYGATAAPSERAYATVNDSPEAQTLSWEISTDPVEVGVDGVTATAQVTIDSTKVNASKLKELEDKLYGRGSDSTPTLPSISEVINMFKTTTTFDGNGHTA